jgi:hypothetical protein
MFAPDVDGLAVLVENDRHGARGARDSFHGLDGDGVGMALDAAVSGAVGEAVGTDQTAGCARPMIWLGSAPTAMVTSCRRPSDASCSVVRGS